MKAKFYTSCNVFGGDKNWAIKKFRYLSLGFFLDNWSVLEHKLGIVVNPYLAEFLFFNFFVTFHWELNKFSHEQVKEHHDFILPSTTIGYVVYPLTDQSNDMASYISAMLSDE